ncbi:MAG: cytidylate kinase-like family protein [Smithellaceae bacterium]|nr:cytidylate kinase-like family protein [Syntrophaceae bacterium]MDD4240638.1 cytidylate kinase-like family protein [Smithellaceae bacterium]NLX52028.1 cytidylate kinase-like family protein [Deltaproteobacteria bacterium]
MSTGSDKRICVICAWRENCTKRYRVKTNALFDVNCPDYTRDIKLRDKDVDKLVEDQVMRWQKEKKDKPGPVITLSSEAGAGGGWVARILATDLSMTLVGSELIHAVAESAHVSDKVIKSLDEKSISLFDSLISSFFESRHIWPNEYIRRLSMVMHADAQHGNIIIIGRGGSFILKDKAFRVRIIAPFDTRVEKVMRDRKLPLKEAQGYVKKYDTDQIGFIRKYFNEDINDPKHYDIMVNMQNVGIETAAESIKKAFLAWKAVNEIHQG